jgi:hypothetical protein
MAQSTTYIESEIHGARQALDSNVEELERRIHSATDWRHHFGQRPVTWIGVALIGGAVAGLSSGRRPRAGEPAGQRPRRAASGMERTLVGMLDDTVGALVAVAAAKIRNTISEAVPGFREEVDRRTEGRARSSD